MDLVYAILFPISRTSINRFSTFCVKYVLEINVQKDTENESCRPSLKDQ